MKRFILFIFSIFLTFCFANAQNFSQWTNSIQYSVNSLDTVTDAVISIKIGFDSNMNTDYSDLRFEDGSYNSLPYWIEYYDIDTVKVWLKCNLLVAGLNSISAYYGNPFAISESNGDSVFVLFDDFTSSTLDAAKWTSTIQSGASYNITGGELVMNVTQTDNFVSIDSYNQYDLSEGYSFITRARTQTNRGHIFIGYGDGNSLERMNYGGYNLQNGFGMSQAHVDPWQGKCVSNLLQIHNIIENNATINNRFNSIRTINEIQFYSNDILKYIETDTTYFDYGNRNFYLWLNAWDGNNRTLWIDYIGLYKSIGYTAIAAVNGCTDSLACNYDSLANTDDGSCVYPSTSTDTVATCDSSYAWNDSTYTQSGTYSYSGSSASNNYSMSFDGVDDYVEAPSISNYDTIRHNLTLSSWIRLDSSWSYTGTVVARRNFVGNPTGERHHFELTIMSDRSIFFSTSNNQNNTLYSAQLQTAPNVIGLNSWHYVSCTFLNGVVTIYIDGSVVVNQNFGYKEMFPNNHWVNFGRIHRSGGQAFFNEFNGEISDVEIWATVLSQQEIQNYMNCPPTGTESGLVGYWNFEEGSGTTAYDQTSNGNNGTINGATYDANVPSQSCALTNANGCDSTAILNLTINQGDTSYTNITACDNAVWNGTTYTQSGTYSSTVGASNNYSMSFDGIDDEIILSDLTMNNSFSFETYVFIPSSTDLSKSDAGRHIFSTGANNLTWASFAFGISDITLGITQPTIVCEFGSPTSSQFVASQSFPLNIWVHIGITFDNGQLDVYQNGVNILSNSTGISVSTNGYNSRIGNRGNNWGNNQYQFEGNISYLSYWNSILSQQQIQNYMNCPPIGNEAGLVGYWDFEEGSGTTAYDQTSNGNNGVINGANYDSNVPSQSCNLTNANGCDSTAVLNLTINNPTSSYLSVSECEDYIWSVNNVTYSTSGLYIDSSLNADGCTQLDSLDLSIYNTTTSIDIQTACESYTWIDGNTYTNSNNTATYTLAGGNTDGCDSIATLNLTINPSTSSTTAVTACDSYAWNGQTYTSSSQYTWLGVNSNGCDSVATLNLTINPSTSSTTDVTACDSYAWNGQTITTSGSYNQTFTNVAGCDSVHTLVATINSSNTGTTSVTACDTYFWNTQTITSSGNYDQTFTNVAGCDSTHTLVATINYSNTGTTSITACDTYLWNAQTITSSGNYDQTFTNVAGCDSTHTLVATIIFTTIIYDTISICKGESYVVSSSTYNNTGDYTDTILNSNGCLSIIYTNLTVGSSLISSITQVGSVLESTVNGGFMPYSYLWNTLATTEDINITSSGLYWLVVTDSLSCPVDTAYYNGVLHTSISEIGISDLKVYPNPSRDIFNIVFSSNTIQNLDVRVINVVGEVIVSEELDQFLGEYRKQINLEKNAKGIYFLEIETNDGIINKKLILQ